MEIIELFISLQHKKCWFGWLCLESGLFFRVAKWLIHPCGKQGDKKLGKIDVCHPFLGNNKQLRMLCETWIATAGFFLSSNRVCAYIPELLLTGWLTDWVSGTSIDCIPPALHFWPIVARQLEMGSHASERGRERERRMQRWQQSSNAFIENWQGVPGKKTWICLMSSI